MRDLTQIVRDTISGMFTKNIVDEVMRRIEKAIERSGCYDEERAGTVQEHL